MAGYSSLQVNAEHECTHGWPVDEHTTALIHIFHHFQWFNKYPPGFLAPNIRPGQYCQMCFEPLGIYAMSFRPFPTFCNALPCFGLILMFAHLIGLIATINGLSMHPPYYSTPIWCVPDILWLCFDFIYLCRYWYSNCLSNKSTITVIM